MDGARAASMSWPDENPQFRRVWTGPPTRKRPALGGTSGRAVMKTFDSGSRNNKSETVMQRAEREAAG